ncbi:rhodanese-like domain-containing protein [Paucilactobacillus suebicus]|uniref:Rhodanese domain-containing protein n=1 Tax=Paucilactobacillus suebicus DSM 5007 = KCTC 3549 TaxID=1423807 RepID=A0A0R1W3F1_9LACO|nr:rhodanese-like domain-containing protein [Paucilactobacillus suebicus]KRM12384.1 hypothetical protein FD16_GL002379 [Paucilactobacillus suebicus DSM 5007 = KCTC 3549]
MSESISTDQLAVLLAQSQINLIDVRETFEFNVQHIDGAVNHPLSEIDKWDQQLDHNQKYYLICRSGHRSSQAQITLTQLGFDTVNVEGGMLNWHGSTV